MENQGSCGEAVGGSSAMSAMTDDHNGNSAADLFCWWRSLPLNHRPNFCEGDGVKEESLADPWGLSTFGAIAEDGMGVGDKPSPLIPRASSTPSRFQPDVGASYFGDASGDFGASVPAGWMQPKVEIETRALKQCWDDSGVSLQAPSVPQRSSSSTTAPTGVKPTTQMAGLQPIWAARTESLAAPAAAAAAAAAGFFAQNSPAKPEFPEEEEADDDDGDERDGQEARGAAAQPTCELDERRRRNREHAKRSRMRKSARLGGLEEVLLKLRRENARLRQIVKREIPDRAETILRACATDNTDADLVAKHDVVQGMRPAMTTGGSTSSWSGHGGGCDGTKGGGLLSRPKLEGGNNNDYNSSSLDRHVPSALKLMSPSMQSVKALSESQANFILTNPNLIGCPIIYVSPGVLELTGYEASQVLGKNCRFLQGPGTDIGAVSILRNNLAQGRDASVCILNYKYDGTPFWNQLSVGNLFDAQGQVANIIGVLYEVKPMAPRDFRKQLHRVPLPESLLHDSLDSGDDISEHKTMPRSRHSAAALRPATSICSRSNSSSKRGSARVIDSLRRTRAAALSTTGHTDENTI